MDFITNPYVITFIVVAVMVSNIMALKYTANAKFGMTQKAKPKNIEKNIEDKTKSDNDQTNESTPYSS